MKGWRAVPLGAIRKGDWKLIEDFEDKTHALYNLAEDIGETEDLSQKFPEKAAELLEDLIDWRGMTGAPVPVEPNPLYVSSETD